jgi:cytoskeletal protein CcmA (bactofilin family)
MANSDKNILITPNTGSATLNPTIRFTGANNTPLTLRTLDTGTVSFEGTAGQLFSISDGLSGTIFSVNDISGIPSIEVLDTGLTKINQYNGQTVIGSSAALTSSSVAAMLSMVTRSATTPGLIVRGFTSQSANLQEWQNVNPAIVASVGSTGILTASSFIPTSSTVPVNGMYLSAANTLNLATNTTNRMSISDTGLVTIPGALTVTGDFTVNGTTTNINTTNLVVEDKNIILGDVTTPSNTTADGGGITLLGGTNKTFNWVNATSSWTSSEDLDLATGKVLRIAGTQVLSTTQYTGNSATVTNGVYTNGSYADPSWITSLSWSKVSSRPTTLSGYGITDALSNSTSSTQNGYFGDIYLYDDSTPSNYLQITNSANLTAARLLNINTNDADRTISLSGNLTVSSAATISGTNTGDQTITLTGDVTGTGTGSFATTLANSGATAGTYRSVTVDVKGRVTAGTNPTTLSGYGITDAIDTSATGQTKSGTLTAAAFIPSSATVPTNGMYLSAANTLNFATNTTNRMSIDSAGLVTIPGSLTVTGTLTANVAVQTTAKTSAYQLTTADASNIVQMNGAFAFNINSTLSSLPLGTQITLVAQTTGVTVAANGSAPVPTINATPGLKLRAAWSTATLIKMTAAATSGSASTWLLTGDLIA